MKYLFTIIISSLLLLSCEKLTPWNLSSEHDQQLVVDAMITDEMKQQEVFLSRSVKELNQEAEVVKNAELIISSKDSIWLFSPDSLIDGRYISDKAFKIEPQKLYRIQIIDSGMTYSAESHMVPLNSFESLSYVAVHDDSLFRINWVTNAYNFSEPALFEISLNWSHLPDYSHINPDSCKALLYYYALPEVDVSQIFAPDQQNIIFPKGTIIIEKKHSMNHEYANHIRALLLETSWSGGLFDMQAANVGTNLSDGAMGFFACCSVLSDTILVE